LGYGAFPEVGKSAVFGVPEKRLVDTSNQLGQGAFYHWIDDGHLVKVVGTAPYPSQVVPIDVPPPSCGGSAEATFD
jgi:hypothetical protein